MIKSDEDMRDRQMKVCGEIWVLELKLAAMNYLFRGHNGEAAEDEGAFLGLSYFFEDMRKKADAIKQEVEALFKR